MEDNNLRKRERDEGDNDFEPKKLKVSNSNEKNRQLMKGSKNKKNGKEEKEEKTFKAEEKTPKKGKKAEEKETPNETPEETPKETPKKAEEEEKKEEKTKEIKKGKKVEEVQVRSTKITDWTNEEVTSWFLDFEPMEDDMKVWRSLRLDGQSLLLLNSDHLAKYGITLGITLKVCKCIDELRCQSVPKSSCVNDLCNLILTQFKRHIKKDLTKPVQLAINDAGFERVGRDDSIRQAVAAFACRVYERSRGTSHDRQRNPMAATLTTTGGGKSFYLDILARLSPEDLKLCDDKKAMKEILLTMPKGHDVVKELPKIMEEVIEILKNSIGITITYTGESNRTTVDDHKIPSFGLALRALHSYFIGPKTENPNSMDFTTFANAMEELGQFTNRLTLRRAIECIAGHSGKGVLLLVDEIMKAEPTVLETVKQIGTCLDQLTPDVFNTVITTLNLKAIVGERISGRDFLWIPLPPATTAEARKLFQKIIEAKQKSHGSEAQKVLLAFLQCISDCNGHFRSLETLWRMWPQFEQQELSYSMMIRSLACAIESKNGGLQLSHVCAALLGLPVLHSATVPGLTCTYGECIANGIFLNTTTENVDLDKKHCEFVPRVSPVQLLLFATYHYREGAPEIPFAKVILQMLDLEPNFSWQQYELFHGHWETLIRLVLCRTGKTLKTIQDLYHSPKPPQIKKGECLVDNQPKFYLSERSYHICRWSGHFPQQLCYDTKKQIPKVLGQTIIPDSSTNPGFDIVGFENERADRIESQPIVICTQCKFSDPTAATKLDVSTVQAARRLTVAQFSPYFAKGQKLDGLTIKEENTFLVVCAFRDLPLNSKVMTDLPDNTVVLNRDILKALYTPSLATRPQFILPLQSGESIQTDATDPD